MSTNDHLNQIYRCNYILDEKILCVIRKIERDNFVPESYKSFSYSDISIPLGPNSHMLTPSCEAMILQEMEFHENDNVLVVGNGSGHLTECLAYITNSVSAYEHDASIYEFGKKNLDAHSKNRHRIYLYNENIFNSVEKISKYTKIVFTCSMKSYNSFVKYLGENSKTFTFLWQEKSPYSTGIVINKARNSYTLNKNIVTSHTDLIVEI
tara:strand:+ start:1573 stop:2199 length:627 start_codon:yes stop_codon:yes gene_type:complete